MLCCFHLKIHLLEELKKIQREKKGHYKVFLGKRNTSNSCSLAHISPIAFRLQIIVCYTATAVQNKREIFVGTNPMTKPLNIVMINVKIL